MREYFRRLGRLLRFRQPPSFLLIATCVIAFIVMLPIVAVVSRVGADSGGVWSEIAPRVLDVYLINTVILLAGVAVLAGTIGTVTAWLITMYEFPGRRVMEILLLLPFAVPAFVLAYVYTDLLEFAGPVQTLLRDTFGWTRHDYFFPSIRSTTGAILMLSFVLYPYVYLLGRASFLMQPVKASEVARIHGYGSWHRFFRVCLPMARPGLLAGLALALMETLADFGTVEYFGVQTFTTGIYRAWFLRGSPETAAQLSSILMLFVLVVILLEQHSRRERRFASASDMLSPLRRTKLAGVAGWTAFVITLLPVIVGFAIPGSVLLNYTLEQGIGDSSFLTYAGNSLLIATLGALATIGAAAILAYGAHSSRHTVVRFAVRLSTMGYAIPGSVIAVGVLIPLTTLDDAINRLTMEFLGVSVGLVLTGSLFALVFAYMVRFLVIAFNTVDSGFTRLTPELNGAARTLGHGQWSVFLRIHAPLLRGSLFTGALLVFADIMKELPATLLVRPFNFETLATRVYRLASDERLAESAAPALLIVLVGLIPILILSRLTTRTRQSTRDQEYELPSVTSSRYSP